MSRCVFLQSLTALLGRFALPVIAQTKPNSPFKALWLQLAIDQPITLIRETVNPYDKRAVCIDWQGETLGCIPRIGNAADAQLMDRDESLSALIIGLKKIDNPWERIEVEVRWKI